MVDDTYDSDLSGATLSKEFMDLVIDVTKAGTNRVAFTSIAMTWYMKMGGVRPIFKTIITRPVQNSSLHDRSPYFICFVHDFRCQHTQTH
jgi:hypothetical protein